MNINVDTISNVVIYPDGTIIEQMPEKKTWTLREVQKIVEGYIEIVRLSNKRIMVLNEEGKLLGLSPNVKATHIANIDDIIVGTVLICDSKLFN